MGTRVELCKVRKCKKQDSGLDHGLDYGLRFWSEVVQSDDQFLAMPNFLIAAIARSQLDHLLGSIKSAL